jgi:transcriptional regulator with XRE-family HTH domain
MKGRILIMILADKIIQLRKKRGWSQEDLAEKLNVSRQSVSKWEGSNSLPDLNKILKLAEIFGVSTDDLLKDEMEVQENVNVTKKSGNIRIGIEEANHYVEEKVRNSKKIAIGVLITIMSTAPLFALLGIVKSGVLSLNVNFATSIGLGSLFFMVGTGVLFFMKASSFKEEFENYEEQKIDLEYGVKERVKDHQKEYRSHYTLRVSIGVMLLITSSVPLITMAILGGSEDKIMFMLIVLLLMISLGIMTIIPASARYNAYHILLGEGNYTPSKKRQTKKIERMSGVYWPLVTGVYLAWSFWTMDWGITWIVWPIAGVLFAALIALVEMMSSQD